MFGTPSLSLTSPVIVKVAKAPMRLQEPFAAMSSLYVFTIKRVKDPTLVCKLPVSTFDSRASTRLWSQAAPARLGFAAAPEPEL